MSLGGDLDMQLDQELSGDLNEGMDPEPIGESARDYSPPDERRKEQRRKSSASRGRSPSQKSARSSKAGDREDRLQKYLAGLSEYDRSRYQQLLEKNDKLTSELKSIADATQEIINREKDRRRQKYHFEEDEEVKKKTQVLREQQGQLNYLKKKIQAKKRELDNAYQYPLIREKEDQLRNLKRILDELMRERESVTKIQKDQSRALKGLRFSKEEQKRKAELNDEISSIKKENKLLVEKKLELEKDVNKNHSKIVNGKLYIRELKQRLQDFKKNNDGIDYKNITSQDVDELKVKIKELNKERKGMEIRHRQDLRNIEKMKVDLRKENLRLDQMLQDKDKEMRMNSIKMKELKRLQRHRALKPMQEKMELKEMEEKGIEAEPMWQGEGDMEGQEQEYEFVDKEGKEGSRQIRMDDAIQGEGEERQEQQRSQLHQKQPQEQQLQQQQRSRSKSSSRSSSSSRKSKSKFPQREVQKRVQTPEHQHQPQLRLDSEPRQSTPPRTQQPKQQLKLQDSPKNNDRDSFGSLESNNKKDNNSNDGLDMMIGDNNYNKSKNQKKEKEKSIDPFASDDDDDDNNKGKGGGMDLKLDSSSDSLDDLDVDEF